eukprot:3844897-Amphidinium_carterae.1
MMSTRLRLSNGLCVSHNGAGHCGANPFWNSVHVSLPEVGVEWTACFRGRLQPPCGRENSLRELPSSMFVSALNYVVRGNCARLSCSRGDPPA